MISYVDIIAYDIIIETYDIIWLWYDIWNYMYYIWYIISYHRLTYDIIWLTGYHMSTYNIIGYQLSRCERTGRAAGQAQHQWAVQGPQAGPSSIRQGSASRAGSCPYEPSSSLCCCGSGPWHPFSNQDSWPDADSGPAAAASGPAAAAAVWVNGTSPPGSLASNSDTWHSMVYSCIMVTILVSESLVGLAALALYSCTTRLSIRLMLSAGPSTCLPGRAQALAGPLDQQQSMWLLSMQIGLQCCCRPSHPNYFTRQG